MMIATLVGVLQMDGMDKATPNNSDSMEMLKFARRNSQKAHFHKKTQIKQNSQFDILFSRV